MFAYRTERRCPLIRVHVFPVLIADFIHALKIRRLHRKGHCLPHGLPRNQLRFILDPFFSMCAVHSKSKGIATINRHVDSCVIPAVFKHIVKANIHSILILRVLICLKLLLLIPHDIRAPRYIVALRELIERSCARPITQNAFVFCRYGIHCFFLELVIVLGDVECALLFLLHKLKRALTHEFVIHVVGRKRLCLLHLIFQRHSTLSKHISGFSLCLRKLLCTLIAVLYARDLRRRSANPLFVLKR